MTVEVKGARPLSFGALRDGRPSLAVGSLVGSAWACESQVLTQPPSFLKSRANGPRHRPECPSEALHLTVN